MSFVHVELAKGVRGVLKAFVVHHGTGCDGDEFGELVLVVFFISGESDILDHCHRNDFENQIDFSISVFDGFRDDIGKISGGMEAFDILVDDAFVVQGTFSALDIHAEDIFREAAVFRLFESDGIQLLRNGSEGTAET